MNTTLQIWRNHPSTVRQEKYTISFVFPSCKVFSVQSIGGAFNSVIWKTSIFKYLAKIQTFIAVTYPVLLDLHWVGSGFFLNYGSGSREPNQCGSTRIRIRIKSQKLNFYMKNILKIIFVNFHAPESGSSFTDLGQPNKCGPCGAGTTKLHPSITIICWTTSNFKYWCVTLPTVHKKAGSEETWLAVRAEEERPGPGGEGGRLIGPGVPPESGGETPGFPAQPDPEQLIYLHISYNVKQAFWIDKWIKQRWVSKTDRFESGSDL